MISVHLVPAFQDNYIHCVQYNDDQVFIVDPGDAAPVFAFLKATRLRPSAILTTHHHHDHVGGIPTLVQHYGLPVFGPSTRIPAIRHLVDAGSHEIDGLAMEVMPVPGHTRDHIAFYFEHSLFCGDTLFAAGCGRLFEGTPAQMHASLSRLARLPDNTRVYCAHEYTLSNLRFARAVEPDNPAIQARMQDVEALRHAGQPSIPSLIGLEKACNPFLRVGESAVQHAAKQFDPDCDTSDPVAVFAALRRWKDQF